jgi:hypothetical protein
MYLSWTGDGPVMDLSYTCAGDVPDHEAAMPAGGRCEPDARSADVDLAMESGAFHSVAPRYRPDQDRGAGSGHLYVIGEPVGDRVVAPAGHSGVILGVM